MKKYSILLLFILSQLSYAEIYKWTDSAGDVHYSDKPHKGALKMELPKPQTYTSPKLPKSIKDKKGKMTLLSRYEDIKVKQPKDDTSVRSNNGDVTIVVEVAPELHKDDAVAFYLDGNLVKSGHKLKTTVKNISRGSHTASAKIISKKEVVLIESKSVTFYLQRHSRLSSKATISGGGRSITAYS